jgi:dGTP triphosphohydrolase
MFTLELLTLLNKIKEDKNNSNLLSSLSKLIIENAQEFEKFKLTPEYTTDISEIISSIESRENSQQKVEETSSHGDDLSKIKQVYIQWIQDFQKNNTINSNCTQLIDSLISFYAPHRFEIIEKILEMQTDQDYERFKNHLKNKLRTYFSKQIVEYTKQERYTSMNFFKKFKKKQELVKLMNNVNNYNFDKKKFKEVLQ